MKCICHTNHIIEVQNFWPGSKCDEYISKSEKMGFEPAMIQTENGPKRIDGVRNNQRILFEDQNLAESIWDDIQQFVPQKIGRSIAIGLNEMFRFYKYEVGQEFKKHRDSSFIRNELEASYYTFMIYLNDNFEGGETTFGDIQISPQKGSALIFLHDLEHEGSKLESGVKYILRTDVMFKLVD